VKLKKVKKSFKKIKDSSERRKLEMREIKRERELGDPRGLRCVK